MEIFGRVKRFFQILAAVTVVASPASAASAKYALILDDAPVVEAMSASHLRPGMQGLAAAGRRQTILAKQAVLQAELKARQFQVASAMQHLLNAVFVTAAPEQVAELQNLAGVKGVVPVRRYRTALNRATQIVNAPAAWSVLGGSGNAGLGIRIAILDTGIDQSHPAFQDAGLAVPPGFPVCPNPADCQFTSNKVIVARSYVAALAAGTGSDPAADSRPDDFSARDLIGHGTAVASVAAGETTTAPLAVITGMAPRAFLGNYKIFGSNEVNGFTDSSALDPALEDAAVRDQMNVAVLSLGSPALTGPQDTGAACGNAPGVPCDIDAATVENAIKAGMIVVIAAGNGGEDGTNLNSQTLGSIGSPGTAVNAITVAATSNSHDFQSDLRIDGPSVPVNLALIADDPGDSVLPNGNITGPLVDASKAGDILACSAFAGGSLRGSVALVTRGSCTFAVKAQNVFAAGGIGMVVVNTDASPVAIGGLVNAPIPSVSIGSADGANLRTYLAANTGVTATIPPGLLEVDVAPDHIATFSSLGPALGMMSLKPEISAPGTAMYMAVQSFDPLGGLYSPGGYFIADGTSFSTPLVAGAAALILQKNPGFTPAQVKSALVNTAARGKSLIGNGVGLPSTSFSVLETGAGRLDAGAAIMTTVTADPPTVSFGALAPASQSLSRRITLTNAAASPVTLALQVKPTASDTTSTLALDQPSVTIAPNGTATVNLSLNGPRPAPGDYEGAVEITGGPVPLHIPYFYAAGDGVPTNYLVYTGDGQTGTVGQELLYGISFRAMDKYGVPVPGLAVAFKPLGGATSALKNTDSMTDAFGIAHTDLTFGPDPCASPCLNAAFHAAMPGYDLTFKNFSRPQPTIVTNGVKDAASGSSAAIVPGAYLSLYGTGLSETSEGNTQTVLPLALDTVSVSFDTPTQSLPGRLSYISPGQVNVQAPWELAGETSVRMKVTIDQSYGNLVTVPVVVAAPAIFTYQDGANGTAAAALDEAFRVIGAGNPVARGHVAQIYANSLGPVSNPPASGFPASGSPLSWTTLPVSATVGGSPAQILFNGLAPGFSSLYQVNLTVPAGVAPGLQPVILSVNGVASPAVNMMVQ